MDETPKPIDSVALVVDILSRSLTVPVSTEIPQKRPQRLVLVEREGGRCDTFYDRPRIGLLCWGASDAEAQGIAIDAAHALAEAATTDRNLSSSSVETMSRDGWAQGNGARYRVVLEMTVNL